MAGVLSAKDKFDDHKMDESHSNLVAKPLTTIEVSMAPNLTSGRFNIVSLVEGNPHAGVDNTKPAEQTVHLNAPVTTWVAREEGENTYRLNVDGYHYTRIQDDKLTASIHDTGNETWIATYRENHDAYTISPLSTTLAAWSVFDSQTVPNAPVRVLALVVSQPGPPAVYVVSQLWKFVPV